MIDWKEILKIKVEKGSGLYSDTGFEHVRYAKKKMDFLNETDILQKRIFLPDGTQVILKATQDNQRIKIVTPEYPSPSFKEEVVKPSVSLEEEKLYPRLTENTVMDMQLVPIWGTHPDEGIWPPITGFLVAFLDPSNDSFTEMQYYLVAKDPISATGEYLYEEGFATGRPEPMPMDVYWFWYDLLTEYEVDWDITGVLSVNNRPMGTFEVESFDRKTTYESERIEELERISHAVGMGFDQCISDYLPQEMSSFSGKPYSGVGWTPFIGYHGILFPQGLDIGQSLSVVSSLYLQDKIVKTAAPLTITRTGLTTFIYNGEWLGVFNINLTAWDDLYFYIYSVTQYDGGQDANYVTYYINTSGQDWLLWEGDPAAFIDISTITAGIYNWGSEQSPIPVYSYCIQKYFWYDPNSYSNIYGIIFDGKRYEQEYHKEYHHGNEFTNDLGARKYSWGYLKPGRLIKEGRWAQYVF